MTAPTDSLRAMGPLEWSLLLLLSLLWGGSFFLVEVALEGLPPMTIVAARAGGAAIILHLVVRILGARMPLGAAPWRAFFVMGFFNNLLPFLLIVWGQTRIGGGLAAILNATTPLFGVLVAHVLVDERLTLGRVLGVIVGFAGVIAMLGPELVGGLGAEVLAQLAVLAAAISYALAGVFGRRFRRMGLTPVQTATGQVTATVTMLGPFALVIERPWALATPAPEVWIAMAGLAVLSTAVSYVIYFRILAVSGATSVLLVTFLNPVSAILLGASILGERLAFQHFLGMALIGLGLALIDGRLLPRRSGRAPPQP